MPYYVYILECANKSLYTGITTDLKRRLAEHKSGKGCRYTAYNRPRKIRHSEVYATRSKAAKREAEIKGWTRAEKIALISGISSKAILQVLELRDISILFPYFVL